MSAPMHLLLLLLVVIAQSTDAFVVSPLLGRFATTKTTTTPGSYLFMGRRNGLQEFVEEPLVKSTDDDYCLVDFGNFWSKTQANFTALSDDDEQVPDRAPDFKSKGSKGSKYWDMGDYVIRYSDHWSGQHGIGRIVDCEWTIDITYEKKTFSTAKCKYTDFRKGKVTANEKRKLRQKKKR